MKAQKGTNLNSHLVISLESPLWQFNRFGVRKTFYYIRQSLRTGEEKGSPIFNGFLPIRVFRHEISKVIVGYNDAPTLMSHLNDVSAPHDK